MDNVKLSEQQVKELKDYIKAKGFTDPAVINEILDHFACKVEEELEVNPELSFYDAIHQARKSFGVMGFAPIAESFTKQLRSKYIKVYWRTFWKTITSPLYIPLLCLLGYVCYKSWYWASVNNYKHILDMNDVSSLLIISFVIVQGAILYQGGAQKNFYRQAAKGATWLFPWTFIYLMPNVGRHNINPWVPALVVSILSIWGVVQLIALHATIKTAKEDYEEVKQFFST